MVSRYLQLSIVRTGLFLTFFVAFGLLHPKALPAAAASGPCTAPQTDYGTVTTAVSIPVGTATATYQVWTRLAAADTTNNHYLLEVDGASTSCYQIGGSNAKAVPVYSSDDDANGTRFKDDSSNWLDTDTNGSAVSVSLPAGSTTIRLIGDAPGVVLDRLIFTQDTSCTPSGTGDNCVIATDATPPTVDIPGLAANTIIAGSATNPFTLNASASDPSGVKNVVFLIDGTIKSTAMAPPYRYGLDTSAITPGTHTISVRATDNSANPNVSSPVNVVVRVSVLSDVTRDCRVNFSDISAVVPRLGTTGSALGATDVNGDGKINFSDISAVIPKLGQTPC